MPFRLGPMELILILVVVMIIFGVGRLPQVGGAMGKAIKEFRKSQSEIEDVTKDITPEEEKKEKSVT